MKKLIVLFAIALCLCATNKAISQVVDSGTTGDCTWTLTGTAGNYTLTISGNSAMANYLYLDNYAPWYSHRSDIKTLDIQQGVTTIGNWAFSECSGLTSVTIPNSVTTIGTFAFCDCSGLTSVTIGNSVTTIRDSAFEMCTGLTSVTIPNSVTDIEYRAFRTCSSLTSITIGNSVTTIGYEAFSYCSSLTSVTIPNSVTTIRDEAFYQCSGLTSVTIPNSITIIEWGTFSYCSGLTSVTIPNSVTDIRDKAFYKCSGLTSVTIGNSVTTIGNYAFYDCYNLTEMYVKAQNPPVLGGYDVFFKVPKTIPVHIPCGSIEAYQNEPEWNFTNYIYDLPLVNISVESSNPAMGTANVIRANTCTSNMAIIGATANAGYRFVQWNDGNTHNPRTITVTRNTTFTAEFEPEVGISEIDASAVAIYPNPVVDNITVTLPESVAQAVFTLCDMQGRVLIYKYIGSGDAVSVDGLAAGMYVYNVVTEKGSHKGKIEIKK
jgi:hypothetical protein